MYLCLPLNWRVVRTPYFGLDAASKAGFRYPEHYLGTRGFVGNHENDNQVTKARSHGSVQDKVWFNVEHHYQT